MVQTLERKGGRNRKICYSQLSDLLGWDFLTFQLNITSGTGGQNQSENRLPTKAISVILTSKIFLHRCVSLRKVNKGKQR